MMPQFDTFTFLSQLFWVFLTFSLLYIVLSYYLLPATAVTLKVRRRKLMLSMTSSDSVANTSLKLGPVFERLLNSLSKEKQKDSDGQFSGLSFVGPLALTELCIKAFTSKLSIRLLNYIFWKVKLKSVKNNKTK